MLIIMASLSAFMIPGFVLKKFKMLGESATLTLSNILLYVCQPALCLKAFCVFSENDWKVVNSVGKLVLLKNFAIAFALSVLSIALVYGLCKLVFIRTKNKKAADVYSYIAMFSNSGFLGVPFIEMFTDGDPLAVMYIMVFNVAFNIGNWTLGVALVTGDWKQIRIKKLILNPTIISIVLGLLLFFVPQINIFMMEGVKELAVIPQYLAIMSAPLSMLIVGIRIADSSVKELFGSGGSYLAGSLRLFAAPVITFALAAVFALIIKSAGAGLSGSEEYMLLAPVIAMAMSPASSVVAMAERFDGDRRTATSAFVTCTLLSIIAIPLVISAVTALWAFV